MTVSGGAGKASGVARTPARGYRVNGDPRAVGRQQIAVRMVHTDPAQVFRRGHVAQLSLTAGVQELLRQFQNQYDAEIVADLEDVGKPVS